MAFPQSVHDCSELGKRTLTARNVFHDSQCAIAEQDFTLAANLINRALQTGPSNPATWGRVHSLMMVCHGASGRMSEAVGCFEDALAAFTQIVPVAHPLVLELCTRLGDLYFDHSAFDHAYLCHHICAVLAERELGQFHPSNAMLFCKLAVLLQKRGSFKQALPFAKASFALYEEVMLAGLDIEQEVLSTWRSCHNPFWPRGIWL